MKRSVGIGLLVAASVVIVLVVGLVLTRSRPGSDRLPASSPSSREGSAATTLEERPAETSPAPQPTDVSGGSPASKEAGVGVPVYARAKRVVARSGQGDGARWYEVSFVTFDPFEQVVKFYQGQAGRKATTYMSTSTKVKSVLIAIAPTFQDQTTVNISRDVESPETKVVILRNLLLLPNQPDRKQSREGAGG